MNTRHAIVDTALGDLTIAAVDDAVVGIYFPHHWHLPPEGSIGPLTTTDEDPLLARAAEELREYLDGSRRCFDVTIATHGTPFEEQVWALLKEIPFGRTTTYGELAAELGDRALARRVGQAVGHNPLSIVIACHRVLGKDGSLTGYAGGLERKQHLLDLEAPAEVRSGQLF